MKLKFSVAVLAAVAMAIAASPADAKGKKKGSKAAKVTVTRSDAPTSFWAGQHYACTSVGSGFWYPIAAVGAVGCSAFYAVPVMVEGFVWPAGKA